MLVGGITRPPSQGFVVHATPITDRLEGNALYGIPPIAAINVRDASFDQRMHARATPRQGALPVIQAEHDDATRPRNAEFILERTGSSRKELLLLRNSYRVITVDLERARHGIRRTVKRGRSTHLIPTLRVFETTWMGLLTEFCARAKLNRSLFDCRYITDKQRSNAIARSARRLFMSSLRRGTV